MKRKTNIQEFKIANSCTADWNKMSNDEANRHCQLCNKTVYDFTNLKENEIIDFFENQHKQASKTCGRFNKDQLKGINLSLNGKSNYLTRVSPILVGLMLTSASCKVYKQDQIVCNEHISTIEILDQLDSSNLAENKIYGQILDENNEPLPFATAHIKGTERGVESDFYGKFELDISGLDLNETYLQTSYIGYHSFEVKLFDIKENKFKITLADPRELMGDVIVVYKPRIKNIFKRKTN
ncbi:carboxypeptidase-like regulatory domain-containing protein [Portibacter lacus]|uniref:Carboxypeptidase-like regulatory domain-containing protein n=1 Tax=Portibacter lacus TaxID=1099794 RepID=A0AA37WDZ3_9BACT|nr:carboxypeptidase-like regulatory domain-containing protein [Portibacter lacus]GLR16154.1 hypothetical protein GCM10007940_07690 [Portibacter lacus]